jgi:hypothetical protein
MHGLPAPQVSVLVLQLSAVAQFNVQVSVDCIVSQLQFPWQFLISEFA